MNNITRGTILYADLKSEGSVQGGLRPCVVVSNNKANQFSPILIVTPVTSRRKRYIPTHVEIEPSTENGLESLSTVLTEQVLTIPKDSVKRVVGALNEKEIKFIDKALRISLAM